MILTLGIDVETRRWLDGLRRAHFPPSRNHLSAHLTLFHALPGAEFDGLRADIAEAAERAPFALVVDGLRFLGRGVAYTVRSVELEALRTGLARRWAVHLTPQDRQRFAAHVTIQNKVDPGEAKALFGDLSRDFRPRDAEAVGLELWWYDGGPWERAEEFAFSAAARAPRTKA